MNEIVIYGAGGLGREVAQLLDDFNGQNPQWSVLGFLSDDATSHGRIVGDLPVLGGSEWAHARTLPGFQLASERHREWIAGDVRGNTHPAIGTAGQQHADADAHAHAHRLSP